MNAMTLPAMIHQKKLGEARRATSRPYNQMCDLLGCTLRRHVKSRGRRVRDLCNGAAFGDAHASQLSQTGLRTACTGSKRQARALAQRGRR
jgi:hypothetical protein